MKKASLTIFFFVMLSLFFINTISGQKDKMSITSPNGKIKANISLSDEGKVFYTISYGKELVISKSRLGIIREDEDLSIGLMLDFVTDAQLIKDSYTLNAGKRSKCEYLANKKIFLLKNKNGAKMEVIFQVSNDGVAYRYHFPETSPDIKKIKEETTSFHFMETTKTWMHFCPDSKTGWEKTQPSYEENYEQGVEVGKRAPSQAGWVMPALFNYKNYWIALTEAGLDRNYCASRLSQNSTDGEYFINFPQATEGFPGGAVTPESVLPWFTPWRVIALGNSLQSIMESTLGTDVSEPAKYEAPFVNPGHASWSWVILKDNSITYDLQKKFIDYAADMNWGYCLIDAYWDTTIGYEKIKELADYAATKKVGILLWYNSAGDWNTTPQTPRSALLTKESRQAEFQKLKDMGIKGIKVDFFGGDGQSMIAYYQDIFTDAAKYGIMVNCHGSTYPRGWHRTYPNLVTMEAVKGYEFLTFAQGNADKEAEHCCTLPFTRNLFDPMDFTPTCFSGIPNIKRKSTNGFELALSVLFLSGIQHFAEIPDGMTKVPAYVKDFMKNLPTKWNDVKFIDGYPGKFVIIARKAGNNWYVAGINGENTEKTVSFKLPFASKNQTAALITDGADKNSFDSKEIIVSPNKELEIKLKATGGFVIKL
jgi:hypothetical protein